jgi:tRNA dimethylallyltransferase
VVATRRLIAVVGPTATGKTEVAAAIAEAFHGEIIGADAYQLYRGLDIGTAKPPASLRARIPHHLVDEVEVTEDFSLARYLDLATAAIDDIWTRNRLPIVCGGSGQYVWALIEGWQVPRVAPDASLRRELEQFAAEDGPAALYERLQRADPAAAAQLDPRNVRRVIRALEVVERQGRPLSACRARRPIDASVLVVGLTCDRTELHKRIDARVDAMFAAGLVAEVEGLDARGLGDSRPVRSALGYKEVSAYLDGASTLDEAIERTKTGTHRLARNQSAWFKKTDPRIRWIDAGTQAPVRARDVVRDWIEVS